MATTVIEAASLLNDSLRKLGYTYQIDVTNNDTATAGIREVGSYSPTQRNNLLDQMNLVLLFRNYGVMFDKKDDPFTVFWRDAVNYGGGIEDIYHDIIATDDGLWAEDAIDDEGAEALAIDAYKFKKDNIVKKFHTDVQGFRVKMSRTDLELSMIFTAEGLTRYVDVQMANMQWSANVKLQQMTIAQIVKMVTDTKITIQPNYNINSVDGVTTFVEAVNTASDAMQQISTEYNFSGVTTKSDKSNLFLITTPDVINRLKSRGYANAFNLEQYENTNRLIIAPMGTNFGSANGQKVLAMLLDRRAIVMAIRYWAMRPKVIENSDFINYFLNVKFIGGYNEFFNAVAFTGGEVSENFQSGDVIADACMLRIVNTSTTDPGYVVYANGKLLSPYLTLYSDSYSAAAENYYKVNKGDLIEFNITNEPGTFMNCTFEMDGKIVAEYNGQYSDAVISNQVEFYVFGDYNKFTFSE